jgi:hypothetical protein
MPPRTVALATCIIIASPIWLIALYVAALVVDGRQSHREADAFHGIEMGASEAAVVRTMGKPDVERPCGDNLWWGGDHEYRGRNDGRCVAEVRYEHMLGAWAVGYSADRRVVSKYRYVSE